MAVMAYAVNGTNIATAERTLFWRSDVPVASRQILEPKLKLEVNKAGSFSFSIHKNNAAYSLLHPLKTIIEVRDDGVMLFRGRVLDIKRDLYGLRKVTCEGDLTFLLDSYYQRENYNATIEEFFTDVLVKYNQQQGYSDPQSENDIKWIYKGIITVPNSNVKHDFSVSSYTKCSDVLDSELLQVYGGILRTRYSDDNYTALDYLRDPSQPLPDGQEDFPLNDKGVRYGVNLVDFEEEYPIQDIFTVLLPLGSNKLKIGSVNGGNDYLENAEAVAKFGRIVRVESWDDISNATTLKNTAQKFLDEQAKVYPNDLTVKAVDLRCLDKSNTPISLMDRVKVVIKPLDIDIIMFCLSIEYDFYNPENNSYKLGTFIPSDKHKGSKKSGRSRGGSGSSSSSRGISSGVSSVSTEVAEFKDQTKEDFTLVRENISLQAAELISLQAKEIELEAGVANHESRISLNEDQIAMKVTKGDVSTQLTVELENVTVTNGNLIVDGYVTAAELSATNAKLNSFYSTSGSSVILRTDSLDVSTSLTLKDGSVYRGMHWNDVFKNGYVNTDEVKIVSNNSLNLAHYHAITATAGTGDNYGKIILTLGSPSNQPEDRTTNFNIADTQFYKDGVSAAKSVMGVSVDGAVVKAAESVTKQVLIKQVLDHSYAAHRYTFKAYTGVGDNVGADNYMIYGVYTTDDQAYQDGLAEGGSAVTVSSSWTGSSSNSYNNVRATASNGNYTDVSVYLVPQTSWSNGSKIVYLRSGSTGGTSRARTTVDVPTPSWNSISPFIAQQTVTISVGGKTYSHTFTSASG